MNEATLIALRDMAVTLGTTTEYLWAALLRQAPITGTLHAVLTVICLAVFSYSVYHTTKTWAEYNNLRLVDVVAIISGIGSVVGVCTLNSTLAALFNPEYWALMQILGKL